jgi:hypothetical protein
LKSKAYVVHSLLLTFKIKILGLSIPFAVVQASKNGLKELMVFNGTMNFDGSR